MNGPQKAKGAALVGADSTGSTGRCDALRVTLYSDALYYGGAERYLVALAQNLHGYGGGQVGSPEAGVLAVRISAIVESAPGAARLVGEFDDIGVPVARAPRPGFEWWKKLPELVQLFRDVPGDLLHINLPSSYDAGVSSVAWAAKRAGYRAVVTTEHLPMVERKYKKFPIKFFFSHWVDRAIAIAEANRPLLVHRHGVDPDRVVALPNGIDAPAILPPGEIAALRGQWNVRGRAVVGCVGRLTERKGQHHLIAACARLDRATRPLLVLVGEGEEEEALRTLAETLGVETVFTGSRADAASLPQAFDLFALASSVETMPLTVLEAMAGSCPVLATRIYGLPEMVDDGITGCLVQPGDVSALAQTMKEMIALPDRLRDMGLEGKRRYEERFTSARMAARTLEVYRSALRGVAVPAEPGVGEAA